MRGAMGSQGIRGTDLQVVAPAGQVDAVTAFQWQSPICADRHRVRLLRGAQEIWSATTDATRLPVDARLVAPAQTFALTR